MTHSKTFKQNGTATRLADGATEVLEKSVLGSLLINPSLFFEVNTTIEPVMFEIWRGVAELVWSKMDEKGKTDAQEITYEAKRIGIADAGKVYKLLANAVPSSIQQHAQEIQKAFILKNEVRISREFTTRLQQGESLEDAKRWQEGELELVYGHTDDKSIRRIDKANQFLDDLADRRSGKIAAGYTMGDERLDALLGGHVPGRLIILAGRPGMGKTTAGLQISLAPALKQAVPVLILSLEMSHDEILQKYAQNQTGIPRDRMQTGQISEGAYEQITEAVERYYELPIFIEDNVFGFVQAKNVIRQYVRKYGVKVVMIDYLQLLEDRSEKYQSKTLEVEAITRGLKLLSKSEGVSIVCLSQLSRSVETRGGDKRPMMSDLRHSGGIEQDADQILFAYRAEYYGIMEDGQGQSLNGITELNPAKNRHKSGQLKPIYFQYDLERDLLKPSDYSLDGNNGYTQPTQPKAEKETSFPFAYGSSSGMNPANDEDEVPF